MTFVSQRKSQSRNRLRFRHQKESVVRKIVLTSLCLAFSFALLLRFTVRNLSLVYKLGYTTTMTISKRVIFVPVAKISLTQLLSITTFVRRDLLLCSPSPGGGAHPFVFLLDPHSGSTKIIQFIIIIIISGHNSQGPQTVRYN